MRKYREFKIAEIFSLGTQKKTTHYIYAANAQWGHKSCIDTTLQHRESGVVNKKQINWSNNPQIGNRDKT